MAQSPVIMTAVTSPALAAFMRHVGDELRLAEVQIRRTGPGFDLRHVADAAVPSDSLRTLEPSELRDWAQVNETGAFRPNKTAPGLRRGWCCRTMGPEDLETALDGLYPGAVADWYAVAQGTAVVTSFREFAGRQTGMYRATGQMTDAQASSAIRAGCDARCCLRQRHWTVDGLAPDEPGTRSEIPCLEPCALWLEFARRAVRLEQEERVAIGWGAGELASLEAAVALALEHPDPTVREGDTSAPANPRRLLLLRNRLAGLRAPSKPAKDV